MSPVGGGLKVLGGGVWILEKAETNSFCNFYLYMLLLLLWTFCEDESQQTQFDMNGHLFPEGIA